MKYLTIFLFCLPSFSFAQTPQRHFGPERKDNMVIIETTDSDSVAYDQLISLLAANEWSVEQQDRKNFLIRTTIRAIPALLSAETYLVIRRTPSTPRADGTPSITITITGYLKGVVSGFLINDEVNFVGAEKGAYKKSFYKMQDIAKSYQNGNVLYGRP